MDRIKIFDKKIFNGLLWCKKMARVFVMHSIWALHGYTKMFGMHTQVNIREVLECTWEAGNRSDTHAELTIGHVVLEIRNIC